MCISLSPVFAEEDVVHAVGLLAHGSPLLVRVFLDVPRHSLQRRPPAVPETPGVGNVRRRVAGRKSREVTLQGHVRNAPLEGPHW